MVVGLTTIYTISGDRNSKKDRQYKALPKGRRQNEKSK
jgi:hypothetical protein